MNCPNKGNDPRLLALASGQKEKGIFHTKFITLKSGLSIFVAGAALAGFFASFLPTRPALADGAGEPETRFFSMVSSSDEKTNPVPPSKPWRPEVDQKEAEILARLLWSSPLENETDKRKLCWLVFNRVDDERYGLFGATVETVVIKREFTFYDRKAFLSETNLRIASDELARWTAERMGIPVERPLESEYLYLRFSGHSVEFLKEK